MASSEVAYAIPAPIPTDAPLSNGDLPSLPNKPDPSPAIAEQSDSDLSDAVEDPASLAPDQNIHPSANSNENQIFDDESTPEEDAFGSDDLDYDAETPPPPQQVEAYRADRSSSEDSSKQRKRKLPINDNEHIHNDPELYGLRRSGRPRQALNMNDTDSGIDDTDSDIQRGPPRKRRKPVPSISVNGHTPSGRSVSESDSDIDDYGGSKRAATKQRNRFLQRPARDDTPVHGEVRFSTRTTAKRGNYNEDDDGLLDDVDMEPQSWIYVDEDQSPSIDVILNFRPVTGTIEEMDQAPTRDDYEYFIKWQARAHCHATWEPNSALIGRRGYRRLENYFRKVAAEEWNMVHDKSVALEEREKWNLDRERDLDALNDYTQVERVIGFREDEGNPQYYIKWKGLFYESSTWEDAALISDLAQDQIDRYLERNSSIPHSDKTESNSKTRSEYSTIREQPSYIKHGQLRDFQIKGLNFLAFNWCKSKNVILADEMGLGKTVQTVAFINWLRHDRDQQGPFIVIVPLSTVPAWAETFDNWTPDVNYVVYNGNEKSRNIIKDYELLTPDRRPKFHVLVTTYEYILADASFLSQIKWQFMAVDEAHRLKNRESHLYGKLLDFKAPSRLLITGTPMQNTLGELSALMDFLMPGQVKVEANLDLTDEAAGKVIDELSKQIQPYMLRRTKNKVENDLPPKTEKIIRVVLADKQMEYYKAIISRNYSALSELGKGHKHTLLNVMMELKKASNHPLLFEGADETIFDGSGRKEDILKGLITTSGKMMLLDQLLQKLKKDGHRVLIFSQMVKMLNLLGEYLHQRNYQYQRLDGTIAASTRRMAIDHFNAPDSKDFAFLLSTRAGGLGINLMTADTVILFDSDWNPQADLQAMARAHRIGQTRPVSIYRLVSKETIEEEVLERARNKLMLEFITIQRGVTDKDSKEFNDRLALVGKSVAEPNSSEDIARILKKRGQKMFMQNDNQQKLETLDIDNVLENAEEHSTVQAEGIAADGGAEFLKSFEYMDVEVDLKWDDIIPKEQLEAIKAEEKEKADQAFLDKYAEENAPRKRKAADDEREERAAKKRARDMAALEAAEDSDQGSGLDPSRPLGEKESRNLIRAFLRYGLVDERREELLQDARLASRDINVVKQTLQEVIDLANQLVNDEQRRIDDIERSGKTLTKKDRKAVLFDFRGVKRNNAETVVERPDEMRMLQELVGKVNDWKAFRVPEASKPATYTCEWGPKEDGMLLIGIVRHGFGAWTLIRDDPDLGLQRKLFLEEHRVEKKEERTLGNEKGVKSPGAVHLVRRTDYLLSVLKEKVSGGTNLAAKRAVENHHRNNKKHHIQARLADGRGLSSSPAPQVARRIHPDADRHRPRNSAERRTSHGNTNGYSLGHERPRSSVEHHHHHASPQRAKNSDGGPPERKIDTLLWKLFKPVRANLRAIQHATKQEMPSKTERAATLRKELLMIGEHVKGLMEDEGGDMGLSFWDFVAGYWPNPGTEGEKIKSMFERLADAERTQKEPKVPKEPKEPKPEIESAASPPNNLKNEDAA